jgi:phosphohistidine phosphatase
MLLYLVHHGDALGPEVDPRRPLSTDGRRAVERLAADAAARGARPDVVWHSGKLRSRQTAEIFWRACNALGTFAATRDLQPTDPPAIMRDRLRYEARDLMLVGHFPHLPQLLMLLERLSDGPDAASAGEIDLKNAPSLKHGPGDFPAHGIVALRTDDDGATWREVWRVSPESVG